MRELRATLSAFNNICALLFNNLAAMASMQTIVVSSGYHRQSRQFHRAFKGIVLLACHPGLMLCAGAGRQNPFHQHAMSMHGEP
jgi:NADH:ubiquinone oxidoreductase subunit 2 (subunit N)